MNNILTVQSQSPSSPKYKRESPQETEAALTFDTVNSRANTITSVLENILREQSTGKGAHTNKPQNYETERDIENEEG